MKKSNYFKSNLESTRNLKQVCKKAYLQQKKRKKPHKKKVQGRIYKIGEKSTQMEPRLFFFGDIKSLVILLEKIEK